jgi:hypothetical protein
MEAVMAGVMVTLPDWSIETEDAMFISRLRTIGDVPTVKPGLKLMVAVIGPGTDFWSSRIVAGSIYMTVADEILTVAPEYVPCGTFIKEIGSTVPMRCIISTGVEDDTTATLPPPLLLRDIDPMVMLRASSRSDGASPILSWSGVVFA